MEQEYSTLKRSIKDIGYWGTISQASNVADSLVLSAWNDLSIHRSLRVHKRGDKWFVSLPGPFHFRVTKVDRLFELCQVLLESSRISGNGPHITDAIRREHSLVEITDVEWSRMERDFELRHWRRQGWQEMDEAEQEEVWDRFYK